jgi:hypothetical protein
MGERVEAGASLLSIARIEERMVHANSLVKLTR